MVDPVAVCRGVQPSKFQQANEFFFLPSGSQLSSLTKEEYDSEVIAHGMKLTSILCSISIKDSVEYGTPL